MQNTDIFVSFFALTYKSFASEIDLALLVTGGLALARCGLNPVLYAFLGLRFRQDLRRLLRGGGCSSGPHPRGRCPRRPRLSSCSAPTETHSVSFWDN